VTASSPRSQIEDQYGTVAGVFAALASPVRAAIVHRLTLGGATVGRLADELGISQPLTSQHLRTLRLHGLVTVDKNGRESTYRLSDDHVTHVFLDALQHSREDAGPL
jgi:DNA-binding transcriptional ArsR family regulator